MLDRSSIRFIHASTLPRLSDGSTPSSSWTRLISFLSRQETHSSAASRSDAAEESAGARRWCRHSGSFCGDLSHGRCENRYGALPFERCRWSEYRIESGVARIVGDFLAARQVIGGQLAFRNIEQLAHASVRQIENSQSFGARSADTPFDFEGRDSSWLVVAEQLSPRSVLARRRIPNAGAAGSVISSRRYGWIGRVRELVSRRDARPELSERAPQVAREESSTAAVTLDVSPLDVSPF